MDELLHLTWGMGKTDSYSLWHGHGNEQHHAEHTSAGKITRLIEFLKHFMKIPIKPYKALLVFCSIDKALRL